ncbi:MAG: helix-turn-helix transcriptional regulator [Umezawaea sp.]
MSGPAELLAEARHSAGLSQEELARRAGTSRPTVSAYEHGRKSPTVDTLARLLSETNHELVLAPKTEVVEHVTMRGRSVFTLRSLPRLPLEQAFSTVVLPLHLNWSAPQRRFNLANRAERARVYEMVLREGGPEDVLTYVDGALLVDLWDELVIPRDVRAAWAPTVERAFGEAA